MRYRDEFGKSYSEDSFQDKFLKLLYGTIIGRILVKPLTHPFVSKIGGRVLNLRLSACLIPGFIRKNHIDMEEYEEAVYRSYNDFFIRKIQPGCRPINENPDVFISPCDGKLSVFSIKEDGIFKIKNSVYTVQSLLRDKKLAKKYEGGYCFLIRLTVDNYHHFCYVDHGEKTKNRYIPGIFHTVNPAALDFAKVYKENSRAYTMIRTEHFGDVVQMEVGAMMVGRIVNYHEKTAVHKGEEKGYFEFGGSTVIVFVECGQVDVRPDVLKNMEDGYETLVKMGEAMAYRKEATGTASV